MHRPLFVLAALAGFVRAKLVLVQSLTRHGNRAPNPSITSECPLLYPTRRSVIETFGAIPQGLTRMGMNQCLNAGSVLRQRYIVDMGFLPQQYNPNADRWYFQARGQPRHQQSAAAMAQGLFPPGTGPTTYPDRLQPVAISSWRKDSDFVLNPPSGPCKASIAAAAARWTKTVGLGLVQSNLEVVRALSAVCGTSIETAADPATATKDVVDAIIFLNNEYLPAPPGITPSLRQRAIFLAQTMLMGKLFSEPAQRTVWLGDFPETLLRNMHCAIQAQVPTPTPTAFGWYGSNGAVAGTATPGTAMMCPDPNAAPSYLGFVSSRELLFVLGLVLGIDFGVPGLPSSALPPAATLSFELHTAEAGTAALEPFVVCRLIIPPRHVDQVNETRSRVLALGACANQEHCPLRVFAEIFGNLTVATGQWRDVCDAEKTTPLVQRGAGLSQLSSSAIVALCGIGVLCFAVGAFFGVARRRRKNAQRATLHAARYKQMSTRGSPMRLLVSPLATPLDAQAEDHCNNEGDIVDNDETQSKAKQYGSINQ